MFFKRFYDDGLAQASYLIGCDGTGEAIVIDANREVATYVAAAAAEKLKIVAVTETHIHADYLSGSRELAKVTGAQLMLSAEGGTDWQYGFAKSDNARLLHNGDTITIGKVRLDVLHTPGHTPEHLSFLVTDGAASERPVGLVSGDFVFVGDVGRPDLLERAAKVEGTMEAAAHQLFHSLEKFRALPDYVQVWPGHGAGSACGKALGAMPQSTVGYEKLANWGVAATDENAFVEEVLAGQPEPPLYFATMKRLNRDGPAILGGMRAPTALAATALTPSVVKEGVVVDIRAADDFAAGYIPGTINIPFGKSYSTWAGWLIPYDRDVVLIAADAMQAARATREMAMIGLDRVAGFATPDSLTAWKAAGNALASIPQTTGEEIAPRVADHSVTVIDVRNRSEWSHGHLPGALHIPVGHLTARLAEIPRDKPVVLQCQGGARSAIASSVLRRAGIADVINLQGGYGQWERDGRPVVEVT
jgi:hydroxyacylglutathione hydrolase